MIEVKSQVTSFGDQLNRLEAGFANLEQITYALSECLRVETGVQQGVPGPYVIVEDCNLHVRNGSGATYFPNGRGNLFVGDNEAGGEVWDPVEEEYAPEECPGPECDLNFRGGSHNLVVGLGHRYPSGAVAGRDNAVSGLAASALGGENNEVIHGRSVAFGGLNHTTRYGYHIVCWAFPST